MQRLALVVLFVHTFALAGLVEATPLKVKAKTIEIPVEVKKAGKEGKATAPIPGGPSDKRALWWNDSKIVKALSLTEEQRKKMGEYLKAYRKKVPQERGPEAFHETLVQGDWKVARAESEKLAKTAQKSVGMRGTLKIDILSVLSVGQRKLLVDRYPRLIYKPWMRAMRGDAPL
jgi:Spy/CpxP family protein refolding chaperone